MYLMNSTTNTMPRTITAAAASPAITPTELELDDDVLPALLLDRFDGVVVRRKMEFVVGAAASVKEPPAAVTETGTTLAVLITNDDPDVPLVVIAV